MGRDGHERGRFGRARRVTPTRPSTRPAPKWAVPRGIRAYMSLWRFPEATKLIDEAEPVLALRDT